MYFYISLYWMSEKSETIGSTKHYSVSILWRKRIKKKRKIFWVLLFLFKASDNQRRNSEWSQWLVTLEHKHSLMCLCTVSLLLVIFLFFFFVLSLELGGEQIWKSPSCRSSEMSRQKQDILFYLWLLPWQSSPCSQ